MYLWMHYVMYIYFVFTAVLWGLRLNLTHVQLFWLFYDVFVFVNAKLFNTYYNINIFLLCILSYYTYSGTEVSLILS